QFVKGLTFDPCGKFLASQSDDRTLRVWRTSDWTQHAVVRQPFEDNIFSTYFRRPSWAPDGDCVAAANAANGKVPVAAVISRSDWTADLSFVGHRAAIEAVRFNPRVFARSADPAVTSCVCAAGGQDRGVSVWLTSQHMPLAAATHLFSGNVMDLAWHTPPQLLEGESDDDSDRVVAYLAACSYDGTVALLEFTQAEIGRPIPIADQEALLIKHGWIKRGADGDTAAADGAMAAATRPILVESVEQLRLEEQGREILLVEKAAERDSRIAQIMDGSLGPSVDETAPSSQAAVSSSADDTSSLPVPVMTKSGKKRVAPVFVRPLTGGGGSKAPSITSSAQPLPPPPPPSKSPVSVNRVAIDAPIWIEARVLGTQLDSGDEIGSKSAALTATVQPLGRQTLIHSQSISAARVHLSVPRIAAHITCTPGVSTSFAAFNQQNALGAKIVSTRSEGTVLWTKYMSGTEVVLLAASDSVAAASCADGSLHLFDSASGARLVPPIMCEAHLAHLRCVEKFCLALDCVGQLTVWDLDRVCAVVDRVSVAPLLYSAELKVDDTQEEEDEGRAPKRHKPSVALTAADVAPLTGAPIVCLSDGRSFTFHLQLRAWLCIGDPAAYAGSDFGTQSLSHSSTALANAPNHHVFTPTSHTRLGFIQEAGWHQHNLSSNPKKRLPSVVSTDKRPAITLDHLEHQLMAAAAIDSPEDVYRYTDILARHLARSGDIARTTFWARSLLGPPLNTSKCPEMIWEPTLAGIPKRQLLARVLPILATNRSLQSVVT
ncbi:HIR complex subunit, partial [Coemansia aciculifera]